MSTNYKTNKDRKKAKQYWRENPEQKYIRPQDYKDHLKALENFSPQPQGNNKKGGGGNNNESSPKPDGLKVTKRVTGAEGKKLTRDIERFSKPLSGKDIEGLASKSDLSVASVLAHAQQMKDVELRPGLQEELKTNPYKYGTAGSNVTLKDFTSREITAEDIGKAAGIDMDSLYKPANQGDYYNAIDRAFKDFEIPQKSDEELFGNRLQIGRKTQEKIDTYNEKYGSRFNKDGQLRFSADGKEINDVPAPKWKDLSKKGKNKDTMNQVRTNMENFKIQGGFKSKPLNSKRLGRYQNKGSKLLGKLGIK